MPLSKAGDQIPPVSAKPKSVNKSVVPLSLQTSNIAFVPELRGASIETVITVLASTQGAEPATKYVNRYVPTAIPVASKMFHCLHLHNH